MFNFKNGAFLPGLLVGIALTALVGIFVLMLVQVTRPVPSAIPQATATAIAAATIEPTAAPTDELTVEPTAVPAGEPTVEPTAEPAGESTVEPTAVLASEPTVEPTAAPAGEPTAEPTAAPAGEPTVEPTAAPAGEPTAVPVSAPTDFPYHDFPTPIPTPVTVPYNGKDQGIGVNLTSVALDGVPQNALQVKPEQVFDVALDYNVWSTLEPIPGGDNSGRCASTCIVNLTVGMVSSDGSYKPLSCIYAGTPGNEPGVRNSWTSSITPPALPGAYDLRLDYHLTYNCDQALADVNPGRPGISLATIRVEPAAPADEPTIGPTAVPAAEQRVPKTGQTQCWDAAGNLIDCAGTGQDGEYQKGIDPAVVRTGAGAATSNVLTWTGVRFVENGDGTVTDNATGLIWLKNANCFDRSAWATALNSANTLASPSCGLSDGSVAGDWRLPNVNEMQSLINPTQANPPLPAGHPFTDVQLEYYWTSTTIPSPVTNAWLVGMQWNGFVTDRGVKAIGAWNKYVWPVRGGL